MAPSAFVGAYPENAANFLYCPSLGRNLNDCQRQTSQMPTFGPAGTPFTLEAARDQNRGMFLLRVLGKSPSNAAEPIPLPVCIRFAVSFQGEPNSYKRLLCCTIAAHHEA
jgi:hypothetical protein